MFTLGRMPELPLCQGARLQHVKIFTKKEVWKLGGYTNNKKIFYIPDSPHCFIFSYYFKKEPLALLPELERAFYLRKTTDYTSSFKLEDNLKEEVFLTFEKEVPLNSNEEEFFQSLQQEEERLNLEKLQLEEEAKKVQNTISENDRKIMGFYLDFIRNQNK